jgi:hypothetical protein
MRWDLLFIDPSCAQQRGRLLLDYLPSFVEQRITEVRQDKSRRLHFDLIAGTSDHRLLMTLGTGIRIEQWAEAIRFKDAEDLPSWTGAFRRRDPPVVTGSGLLLGR